MSEMEAIAALRGARTMTCIDRINLDFLRDLAAGAVAAEEAERIDAAIAEARQRVRGTAAREATTPRPTTPRKRREKVFGEGRRRPMDRNAKARVMVFARALMRRTAKGKAYGAITAKALAVLHALLYGCHNARSGLCFPSYDRLAEIAGCARSTVAKALTALEDAGVLTWVHRLARIRERCRDLFGGDGSRLRVIRTSNSYVLHDPTAVPGRPDSSKSDFRSGISNQESLPLPEATLHRPASRSPAERRADSDPPSPLAASLARFRDLPATATEPGRAKLAVA